MSHGLTIVLVSLRERDARKQIRRRQRWLYGLRLDGVRFGGNPTAETWNYYEAGM